MARIGIFSNPSYGYYGYSIVTKNLAKGLRDLGHEVYVIGNITAGRVIEDEFGNKNLPMYFAGWGQDTIERYIRSYDLQALIVILDVWIDDIQFLPDLCKRMGIPLITHATVRNYPLSPMTARFLVKSDIVVVPSKFGLSTCSEIAELKGKTVYIPHGVNLDIFKPIPGVKEEMKERLGLKDKFVFLAVGRNNWAMKSYWLMFHGYKEMLENLPETKEKTVLYIHTNPVEPNSHNLEVLRERTGLQNYVRFSHVRPTEDKKHVEFCAEDDPHAMLSNPNFGCVEEEINRLYNMGDCMVTSSNGESFNLPMVESMACGLPQVFPNHTVGPEHVQEPKTGLLAGIMAFITSPLITDEAYADPVLLGKCMAHMYLHHRMLKEDTKPVVEVKNDYEEFSRNAMEYAKKYSWGIVVPQWDELIRKMLEPKGMNYRTGDLGI